MRRRLPADRWVLAGIASVAAIAIADLFFDPGINFTGSLAVAPFVAAVGASTAGTALVSVVAVAVGAGLFAVDRPPLSVVLAQSAAVLLAAVLAPAAAQARLRRERALREVTRVAEVAQVALQQPLTPVVGPLTLASAYESASREALIGGDLYAAVETGQSLRLVVGDVRGKGLDAVRLAALVVAAFREASRSPGLTDVVAIIENRLEGHLDVEDFVTAVLAEVGMDGATTIVSCGHPAPVLLRHGAAALVAVEQTTPFGLAPDPVPVRLELAHGERLVFYTDGLVEAREPDGGFVPLDELVSGLGDLEPPAALAEVLAELHRRVPDLTDDLALLLVEYDGTRPGPRRHQAHLPGPRSAAERVPGS